ncbi:hypothetical protein O4J56_28875 [Nocardiopsis sp. RSe5-2]|uniref:Uncharacterized protein n=1 Tax=Nocardiopsis endophytica TaxID=3018445 RepID=A0ABT4UED2_9ACTN|nr:hypothetical protein [Nocardiopsis endophytica]MDA2814692.1 hypothetical protein [Nocardiopsis endophytica]
MRRSFPPADRGASAIEYGAGLLLVAAIGASVFALDVPERVAGFFDTGVECVEARGEGCEGGTPAAGDGGQEGAQSAAGEDLDGVRPMMPAPPGGDDPYGSDGLGEVGPQQSINFDTIPSYPVHYDDAAAMDSAMDYESQTVDCNWFVRGMNRGICPEEQRDYDVATEAMIHAKAAQAGPSPQAGKLLEHYLNNSGDDYEMDVDDFMEEVPAFKEQFEKDQAEIGRSAVDKAKEEGIGPGDGPVTIPVRTEYNTWGRKPGTAEPMYGGDWWRGLGSFGYSQVGQVDVYPPDEPGGEWKYVAKTQPDIKKYYDWDRDSEGEAITGATYSEKELSRLHLRGMAQEFWVQGRGSGQFSEGTVG